MIEGHSDVAITAARRSSRSVPSDQITTFPSLEDFLTVPVLTQARFGRWDAILGEPQPPAELRYATAIWHYARGSPTRASAARPRREAEQAAFEAIASDPAWEQTVLGRGPPRAPPRGRPPSPRRRDRRRPAATPPAPSPSSRPPSQIQDRITYTEPPPFYFPVRQALGAVLLDAGRPADAEAVYRKDLRAVPEERLVALRALSQALRAQGKIGGDALGGAGLRATPGRART